MALRGNIYIYIHIISYGILGCFPIYSSHVTCLYLSLSLSLYIYIYIYIYTFVSLFVYFYIYIYFKNYIKKNEFLLCGTVCFFVEKKMNGNSRVTKIRITSCVVHTRIRVYSFMSNDMPLL